jgi:tetratricopeptide (TPR) repeat protein
MLPLLPHLRHITDAALERADAQAAALATNLGYCLNMIADYAAARPLYERALAIWEQVLGPEHPATATSLNNLAVLCYNEGKLAEAAALMRRALAISEQVLGPQHPDTAISRWWMGVVLQDAGDLAQAAAYIRAAVATFEAVLGPQHPNTQSSRESLAAIEAKLGGQQPQSAEQQIAEIIQQAEAAVAQALASTDAEQRTALQARLEEVAQWAREVEPEGWRYRALAIHLRGLARKLAEG